jgi:hypothetical protein
MILLISASCVARITGVSHQCPASNEILFWLIQTLQGSVCLRDSLNIECKLMYFLSTNLNLMGMSTYLLQPALWEAVVLPLEEKVNRFTR